MNDIEMMKKAITDELSLSQKLKDGTKNSSFVDRLIERFSFNLECKYSAFR